ncbi:hypothetical protein OC498_00055 [Acinetobacter bohemicus]|uniref:Uncharacterized protein n=1 Tax=Acinetobacter lwoffii TaxID=28090 RepID=A0A9D2UQL7_ACILW|nr:MULTISPECIES: hypothetical protein [Acinetobacter]MDM1782387.1 hypothetical protein [Acinetobacter indicus]HJF26878.1 hypothetical protein [Acinetobacter lwoffii]MCO8041154.1 hypothetical protein [Acinetobacter sp. S4400-12]MCO8043849.1 hypothetical protein [Acinetobacter sp. S4397-1]MCU7223322.1 hypothetical protein [Acinetobacter bohemicus]
MKIIRRFVTAHTYDITVIALTLFTRFCEYFHEISDIENAQRAKSIDQLLKLSLQAS